MFSSIFPRVVPEVRKGPVHSMLTVPAPVGDRAYAVNENKQGDRGSHPYQNVMVRADGGVLMQRH